MISCYATDAELFEFAKEKNLNLTQLRHAQVCYLYHVKNLTRASISEITGYAVSTLSTLKNKVLDLLDAAKKIFNDTVQKVKARVKYRKHGNAIIPLNFLEDCGEDTPNTDQVYLFKFYSNNKIPIFSKIGTTTKSAEKRLRQEVAEYRNKGFDIQRVDVCKIEPCGNMPAESFESYLRALLIKDYPNSWKKNDRFFGVDIDTKKFSDYCEFFRNI